MDNKYYTSYKGIFYRYYPPKYEGISGIWSLSDRKDNMGYRMVSTDKRRIDEIFEDFFRNYQKFKEECPWYTADILIEDLFKKMKENGK